LNVFPIRIPPLRDRKEDIPLLVSYFVQKFAKEMQKHIEAVPTAVMKGLTDWDWPATFVELENFIERALLLTRGKSLEAPVAELRKDAIRKGHPMTCAKLSKSLEKGHILRSDKAAFLTKIQENSAMRSYRH